MLGLRFLVSEYMCWVTVMLLWKTWNEWPKRAGADDLRKGCGSATVSWGQLDKQRTQPKRAEFSWVNRGLGLRAPTLSTCILVEIYFWMYMFTIINFMLTICWDFEWLSYDWLNAITDYVFFVMVFLLGLGSRVLRGAGEGKGKLDQPWVRELWGRGVHCQLLVRHGQGIVHGQKSKMCIFPLEWPWLYITLGIL